MKTDGASHGVSIGFRFIKHLMIKDADYSYLLLLMRQWSDHDRLYFLFYFLFRSVQMFSFVAHVGRDNTVNDCLIH